MKKTVFISLLAITALLLPSCADNVGNSADTLPSDEQTAQTQSSTEKNESAFETEASQTATVTPDESYIGIWYTDELKTDDIMITEITSDSVKFNSGVFRHFGFDATAVKTDKVFKFGDGISSDYSGPDGITGKLEFQENCVILTYDSFGDMGIEYDYLGKSDTWPSIYKFSYKDSDITSGAIDDGETTEDPWVTQNRIIPDVIPEFDPNSIKVYSAEEALKNIPYRTTFLPKYRDIYYWEPTFLSHLVTRNEFSIWYDEVVLPNIENNTEPQEMYTVSFVKYFKISKADFEEACEMRREWIETLRDKYGHDVSTEGHEIHNSDIIYTFDNEIINNYYLREQG